MRGNRRSLKSAFFWNEDLARVPIRARYTAAGIATCLADDEGRFKAHPRMVRAAVYPYDKEDGGSVSVGDAITDQELEDHLQAAAGAGVAFIHLYVVDGHRYGVVVNFAKHNPQKFRRPSDLPAPPEVNESEEKPTLPNAHTGIGIVTGVAVGTGVAEGAGASSETANAVSRPAPEREDVLTVCEELQRSEERKGYKKPTITRNWRHDAELILDRDKRPLNEVVRLIRQVETHPFWRMNIRSPGKLRKHFDRLADELAQMARGPTGGPLSKAQAGAAQGLALLSRANALEGVPT